jgi:proline dehydrogenase
LRAFAVASTLGYAAHPGETPRAVADVHLAAFERLSIEDLDCYVSVKLSALGFDPALFGELAVAAERSGRRLHVDALRPETADPTLRILVDTRIPAPLGTTLPGRWRRSVADASRAMDLGLAVRVVKGHWDDPSGSVEPRQGFLEVVDRLRGHSGGVAVATHDVKLLNAALGRLTSSGTPCTAELFLGMPFRGPAAAARSFGVAVRVYVPYGDAWPGYGIPDLVRHPRTIWWLAQDLLLGKDKMWRGIRRSDRPR